MMTEIFSNSKWIWTSENYGINDFAEFCQKIEYDSGRVNVKFSVCGEYTLFVNGRYVKSIQYADFPWYKVYEDVDITPYLTRDENFVCFLCVWWSESGRRWNTPKAGLIFEIENDGRIIAFSDEDTPSRKSRGYLSGYDVKISAQLGYSFLYDAAAEDDWLKGDGVGFGKSVTADCACSLVPSPIKAQKAGNLIKAKSVGEKKNYIFDLGEEYVGFCEFVINSKAEQTIQVCYGELLKDGHVKKILDNRTFCFTYKTKEGRNEFINHTLRLACRYIEIEVEDEIDVEYIGILPCTYPAKAKKYDFLSELDKDIYKICLNTLQLSMLEHYVDCPWREQCLYAFDSRNQMLTGYYAFEDGNFEYARANLLLMSKDNRRDGLMAICFPSGDDRTIPSFCLYYVLAVKEYICHSGDLTLGREVFSKLVRIMNTFMNNRKDGLVCKFTDKANWNFYDWSEYAFGPVSERWGGAFEPDCFINAISVMALSAFEVICEKVGEVNPFAGLKDEISAKVNETFYNTESGFYFVMSPDEQASELVNSLCVVSGVADEEKAKFICEKLASGELIECSLSMKCFKYDALLKTDEIYKENILAEIRNTYKIMLDADSTTVWETKKGESDFRNAGSLCHGWSAIPIYYYHKFFA